MSILRPTLPLTDGESPISFVSNLARLHRTGSARQFCLDMGLTFRAIVNGEPDALERLALLTRSDPEAIARHALAKETPNFSRLRGQRVSKSLVRRRSVHVCPACLQEDLTRSGRPADCSARGRTVWLLSLVTTCPEHGVALVEVARDYEASRMYDFAVLVARAVPDLGPILDDATRRRPNRLQSYLLGRLDGTAGRSPWLDGLEWHAAAKAGAMLGTIATFGRAARFGDADAQRAEEVHDRGFEIADGGVPAIHRLLDDLVASRRSAAIPNDGGRAAYGRLHSWLVDRRAEGEGDLGPLRDAIAEHAANSLPIGPGHNVFGMPVPQRRVHSIRTASTETGIHPRRLKKLLAASGLIPVEGAGERTDPYLVFDAEAARRVLADAVNPITKTALPDHINASREQMKRLVGAGLLRPLTTSGNLRARFARDHVDGFLAALSAACDPDLPLDGLLDVRHAGRRAFCGVVAITRLILDRKLTRVAQDTHVRGFEGLRLDLDELRVHVGRPAMDGLPWTGIWRYLDVPRRVSQALIASGFLPSVKTKNHRNHAAYRYVMYDDADAFKATYVTAQQLARLAGVPPCEFVAGLHERGIEPAFDPRIVKAGIYRRDLLD